jgi:hypothetical protein
MYIVYLVGYRLFHCIGVHGNSVLQNDLVYFLFNL